jgi:outer membrane protein OmpA-like peptidoglycan-associated protein
MRHAVLISTLALACTAVASTGGPKLELRHTNGLDESYRLESISWWLDGAALATWRGVEEQPTPEIQLHPVELEPGMHSLAVTVVYVGDSDLFPYVNGYRFRMRARMVIDARPGYVVQLTSSAFEEEGLTVNWRDRPRFKIDGAPRKAFLEEELLPVEGLPKGTEAPEEIAVAPAAGSPPEPVEVAPDCDGMGPIQFSFAGFTLDEPARKELDALAVCLVKHRKLKVVLSGHCDARGPEDFNLTLASWRIDSAARYLISRGVLPERIQQQAFGEGRPLCSDDTEACHARNRRVEFAVDPSMEARL